jgi:hypothetical protein
MPIPVPDQTPTSFPQQVAIQFPESAVSLEALQNFVVPHVAMHCCFTPSVKPHYYDLCPALPRHILTTTY